MSGKSPYPSRGEKWLTKAAETGDVKAMYVLGELYLDGDELPQNIELGEEWLQESAGEYYMDAMYALGNRYFNGDGLPQNITLGNQWISLADNAKRYPTIFTRKFTPLFFV